MKNLADVRDANFTESFYKFSDEIGVKEGRTHTDLELRMLTEIDSMARAIQIQSRYLNSKDASINDLKKRLADYDQQLSMLSSNCSKLTKELNLLKSGGDNTVEKKTAKKRSASSLQWVYETAGNEVLYSV